MVWEQALFDTKEQGVSHKIGKGAGSRELVILEQGGPNFLKRSMEQRKNLKRSRKHRKMKKEQGKS